MSVKQVRKCVSCRDTKNQDDLIRIARIGDEYLIDANHKLGGRGAYVCNDKKCIDLAIKKKLFNRSFKANIDNSLYEKLGEYE